MAKSSALCQDLLQGAACVSPAISGLSRGHSFTTDRARDILEQLSLGKDGVNQLPDPAGLQNPREKPGKEK